MSVRLSIVIPTLNEESSIESLLEQLQSYRCDGIEIVLCDGGSTDNTLIKAEPLVDLIWRSERGRASQMNAGAMVASGDYLLFLHADTRLPEQFLTHWQMAMKGSPEWGFFAVRLSGRRWLLRIVEQLMNSRSKLTSVATGDQGIFVRRSLFESITGYADIPLMEDIEFCKRLRKIEKPLVIKSPVTTSSRRWESQGVLKTILLMWRLRLAYFLGVSPERLVARYYPAADDGK